MDARLLSVWPRHVSGIAAREQTVPWFVSGLPSDGSREMTVRH